MLARTPRAPHQCLHHIRSLFLCSIGNPEPQYRGTRHNVGNYVMDHLVREWASHLNQVKPGVWRSTKYPVVLFKSKDSFINLSGKPVSTQFKSSREKEMMVIHDELQREPGKFQVREKGTSNRGHNGLKSIDSFVGPSNYEKLSVGIGRPNDPDVVKWVLEPFTPDQLAKVDEAMPRIVKDLESRLAKEVGSK
ncbi:peptidyl-tRNA hydrolase [Diutina catenulata]